MFQEHALCRTSQNYRDHRLNDVFLYTEETHPIIADFPAICSFFKKTKLGTIRGNFFRVNQCKQRKIRPIIADFYAALHTLFGKTITRIIKGNFALLAEQNPFNYSSFHTFFNPLFGKSKPGFSFTLQACENLIIYGDFRAVLHHFRQNETRDYERSFAL